MPPKNNLAAELKWLLKEKPFVPPAVSLVSYDPNAPTSSATVSQHSSFVVPESNDEPEPALIRATTPSNHRPTRATTYTVDIHKPLPGQGEGPEMARLRATPGSGKPRLVMAGIPAHNSPLERSPERLGESASRRNSGSLTNPTSLSRKMRMQANDVEAIDLTTDDGRSSPSPSRALKGRKRKSDEMEGGNMHQKSPRPLRTIAAVELGKDEYEGFAHIDDIISVPESPPPPYSTTIQNARAMQGLQSKNHNITDDSFDLQVSSDYEDHSMTDIAPQASPSNRKRKSLSRVPSETAAPARKIGKQAREPSPLKGSQSKSGNLSTKVSTPQTRQRKVPAAVLDSEDEFDGFDDDDIDPEPETMQYPNQRPPSQSQLARQLPIRSPSIPVEPRSPPQAKVEPKTSPKKARSPRKLRASPKKMESTPTSALLKTQQQPSSEMSREKKKLIRKAVEHFLETEGSCLKRHVESAITSWASAKTAFLRRLESGDAQDEDTAKVARARAQKDALDQLITLKSKHEDLSAERKQTRKKIDDDLDNGTFNSVDGEALVAIVKLLDDVQLQIYSLLEPAAMHEYMKPEGVREIDRDDDGVVVKSTQATPVAKIAAAPEVPGPSHIPQTQYIKQTQISVQEVWTPSRRIRFAEERPVTSPPPRLKLGTSHAQDHALPTERVKPAPRQKSHRVPETPDRHRSPLTETRSNVFSESYESESFRMPEEEFGCDFDDNDVDLFSTTMGAAPESAYNDDVGNDEENFCDDDDDTFLHEVSNIENEPPGGYDWRGDRVESRSLQPSRQIFQEESANRIRQPSIAPSPKKPQLYNPGMNFPWSRDVRDALLFKFHLRGFRPGQLEAINQTLSGEHCFVLMPTGGGKSLCYQLPSVVNSGKTRGVTIVVSPLLSLMEDQVAACKERFNMQAFLINGESTSAEKSFIMEGLREREPQKFIQLLYVTPEMLSKNQRMIAAFQQLHKRHRLARIVIDEAHCVSQWGHDFRPDYKALGDVLRDFSGVPVIALTATATQLVRTDVMSNLGIRGCRLFSQSFNRPNLSYEIRPKAKGVVQNIGDLIQSRYSGKSGIVYCLSRKSCESVAQKLTEQGILAHHYHAGMDSAERSEIQRKWQSNEYHVIVATIAFGMGIDKADVRFVIHHTLPKSLEGYYQETGRAGRDGKRSECYLFYQYADCKTYKKMIEESEGSREQKQRQYDMLRNVIQFCENKSDCRRVQVLGYFSEPFKREDCNGTCDNCMSDATFEEKDLTKYAAAAIRMVRQVEQSNVTVLQCVDAFRGAKNAKLKNAELNEFGFGKDLERGDVERVFNHLLEAHALREESKANTAGFATNYLHLGTRSSDYERGRKQFKLQVRVSPRKPRAKEPKKKATTTKSRPEYPSTNVSSPVRAAPKRNLKQYVYEEDEDDDDYYDEAPHPIRSKSRRGHKGDGSVDADDFNDEFAPIRIAKPLRPTKQKASAAPITVDERVANLSDFQKDVLNDFMEGAKKRIRKIKMDKGLRYPPFSDTILREMCLDLPSNEQEMLDISGINPEMVELYGKSFLSLLNNARNIFGDDAPGHQNQRRKRRAVIPADDDEDEDEDERPLDPNHQTVIDLLSDTEPEQADMETESFYSINEDEDEGEDYEDDEAVHVSHHFSQQVDPRVEHFNSRFSQIEAEKPNARPKAPSAAKPSASKGGPRSNFYKKRSGPRKKGSGSFGKAYSGVTKRGGGKTAGARKSGSMGGAKKGSGGGGGNRKSGGGGGGGGAVSWGSIMAMPT